MSTRHQPTPEFRAFLESEITRTLRRESRFNEPTRPVRTRSRTAVLVVTALALGVAAGAVPAQVQDAQQRSLLIATSQIEEQVALIRLEIAKAELAEARTRLSVGAIDRESLVAAEVAMRAMELKLARVRLNQEEIQASAAAPRDDLAAPRVGDRDFVTERLQLDVTAAQQRLTQAETVLADVERRHAVGVDSDLALAEARGNLDSVTSVFRLLGTKLSLRRAFIEGEIPAAEVERRLQRRQLELAAEDARARHELATERLANLRALHAVGQVEDLDVLRAEVERLELANEMQRMVQRLEEFNARAR